MRLVNDRFLALLSHRRAAIGVIFALCAVFLVLWVLPSLLFGVVMFSQRATIREVERSTSPDHLLDAVVVESQPGFSIETYSYRIYIARAKSRILGAPILEATNLEGLNVNWASPRLLDLSYSSACIATFRNHWSSINVGHGNYDVEIRLKPPEGAKRPPC